MRPRIVPPTGRIAVRCADGRFTCVPCDKYGTFSADTSNGSHSTLAGACRAAWREWEQRVRYFESQGLTRSDAQGVTDAEYYGEWGRLNAPR